MTKLIEKACRCGSIKKRFNMDIGPFFIADCCIEAGYDHLGNRKEPKVKKEGPTRRYTPSGKYSKKNKSEDGQS